MPEGTKYDQGKPRLELLDPLFLTEVAKVLTFGAKKYSPHNWRGGLEVSRLIGACMRHINEFQAGNDTDPETEHTTQHLAHAACNLMFALRMLKDRPDLDDRYKQHPVAIVSSPVVPIESEVEEVGPPPLPEYDDEGNWCYYR